MDALLIKTRRFAPIHLIFILTSLNLIWCELAAGEDDPTLHGLLQDVRGKTVFKFKVHPDLPVYEFHLYGNPKDNAIERIEVFKEENKSPIQTISVIIDETPPKGISYFQAEDINFDGYLDLKLLSMWGATGNTGYFYWLYDPLQEKFIADQQFSSLCNPIPHPQTREISTSAVGGMAGMIHNFGTYRFLDGKLVLVREENQDWIPNKKYFLKVITERQGDQMVKVGEEIVSGEGWQ